jgi:hypothetical protein
LKLKRPDFMQREPPSWTWGWHRQNSGSGGGKVHKYMRTHGSEGATEPGRDEPGPASLAHSGCRFGSPFLAPEGYSTLSSWRCRHSQYREPFAPRGHPQARERGGRSSEKDRPTRRKHPQVEKEEDTVGSATMINGAMSSTLMG